LIGSTTIGAVFAVLRRAACLISYASGLAICATYLGVPTAMWLRPQWDGHSPDKYIYSQSPERFISFDEALCHCWVPPKILEAKQYMPCLYARETPLTIFDHARQYWLNDR